MSVVATLVHPVSALPTIGGSSYTNSKVAYDYAIGGLPFVSAAGDRNPVIRQTSDYTKQQIDTDSEPGEQTLVAWWLRSQSSFHCGSGIVFEEPSSDDTTIQYRFADSAGVDVWTPGKVKLLKSAPLDVVAAGTNPLVMGVTDPVTPADCYFVSTGSTVKRSTGAASASVTWGGSNAVLSMTNDGNSYYIADSVGIYKGTLAGGAGTKLWNTGNANVVIGWSKQRLMAAIGPSIYQLVGGSPPTLPTAVYTHPNPNWVWTSITESPEAIYAAGYAGSVSAVFMFALDTSGVVPTLTSGITVAQMPTGEVIRSIYGYLGSYVAIGTNKGCRIAFVQSDGTLTYGPLTVTLPSGAGAVLSLTGRSRFIYGSYGNAIAGASGLFRIDLGNPLSPGSYAWASDLQSHVTGDVTAVDVMGSSGRMVFAVAGNGSYLQSSTVLEPTGTLTTGNIRFHILEPKLFKFVRVWAAPLTKGGVSITTNSHDGVPTSVVSFTAGIVNDPLDEVAFPSAYGRQEFVSLTIGLSRDVSDSTAGPTVTAYQIKALPAQKRQRTFVLPLLCFDHESDRNGTKAGYQGSAINRLIALETLEENGDTIRFDDLTQGNTPPRQVVIDSLNFQQTVSPKAGERGSGWGGIITATLRAVD